MDVANFTEKSKEAISTASNIATKNSNPEIKSLKLEPPTAYERACNAIPITINIIPYSVFFCFSNSCVLLNKSKICSSS